MERVGLDLIIEHATFRQNSTHELSANSATGVITQIIWSVRSQDDGERLGQVRGLNSIIALANRLRAEGKSMSLAHARGIIQQIDWSIREHARLDGRRRRLEPVVAAAAAEPAATVKRIRRTKFNALCDDACAICLETHIVGESVLTECQHMFGQICWRAWTHAARANNPTCPTCRKVRPTITCFESKPPRPNEQPPQILLDIRRDVILSRRDNSDNN